MSETNEQRKPGDNMEKLKQDAAACSSGCACHATGASSGRMRWALGAIILLAAAALAARALLKSDATPPQAATPAFATPAAESAAVAPAVTATVSPQTDAAMPATSPGTFGTTQTDAAAASITVQTAPAPAGVPAAPADGAPKSQPSETVIGKEIGTFAELNTLAADTTAVFVFLPAIGPAAVKLPTAQMEGAARTIEAQGNKVGLFTLKAGSPDHGKIGAQVPVPAVLALVKGRGMGAVSGEITETKLVQAFVKASSAGGCGSGGGGCGPASAGCK